MDAVTICSDFWAQKEEIFLWKALKKMGVPDHLICLLRNLYVGQEATNRTLCRTREWLRIEKVWQGYHRAFHSLLWYTVKGFSVVDETEVDVFLKFPCFLYDPVNVDNLKSGSSAFSKPSLYIWNFLLRIILRLSMQDFKHDLTSVGCCSVAQSDSLWVAWLFSTPWIAAQ